MGWIRDLIDAHSSPPSRAYFDTSKPFPTEPVADPQPELPPGFTAEAPAVVTIEGVQQLVRDPDGRLAVRIIQPSTEDNPTPAVVLLWL
ncbi:MAG TPA: hypothetical protein VF322_03895 [Gammaproteobacteria bacterium]